MKPPIITVDFDSTLTRKDVQDYIRELISDGVEVWVLTSRYDELTAPRWVNFPDHEHNKDLWVVVDKLKIPRWKVRFNGMESKAEYLNKTRVLWHLEDDDLDVEQINELCINTVAINVDLEDWKINCNKILNERYYSKIN